MTIVTRLMAKLCPSDTDLSSHDNKRARFLNGKYARGHCSAGFRKERMNSTNQKPRFHLQHSILSQKSTNNFGSWALLLVTWPKAKLCPSDPDLSSRDAGNMTICHMTGNRENGEDHSYFCAITCYNWPPPPGWPKQGPSPHLSNFLTPLHLRPPKAEKQIFHRFLGFWGIFLFFWGGGVLVFWRCFFQVFSETFWVL